MSRATIVLAFCVFIYAGSPSPCFAQTPPVLVSDTFSGADGASLTSHTPDVQHASSGWTLNAGGPAPTLQGGLAAVGAGGGHLQLTLNTVYADMRMAVDYRVGTGPHMGALVFRLSDANNFLLLETYQNSLWLYRLNAGNWEAVASAGLSALVNGSTHRLEVRTSGSTVEGWWDGTRQLQLTETFNQTATRHGLDWNSAYDATTTYDNFELRAGTPTVDHLVASGTTSLPFLGSGQLTAVAYDDSNEILPPSAATAINWTTSNSAIVSVAANWINVGTVAAHALGTATITATAPNGVSAMVSETVNAGSYLAYDTFSTMGSLANRIPDVAVTGSTWGITGNAGTPTSTGGVASFTTCCAVTLATIDSGSPDVTVAADWSAPSSSSVIGAVIVRMTDATHYLVAAYETDHLTLYKVTPTGTVLLASHADMANASGATHHLEVRIAGFNIQVWVDGVQYLNVTEGFNATATRHGLEFTTPYTSYDNFHVDGSLPPPITSVVVSPATSTLQYAHSQVLTATAKDASGTTIPNVAFLWTSSDPRAVSVQALTANTAGITANAQGGATITATPTSSATGSANITVDVGDILVLDSFTETATTSLTTHASDIRQVPSAQWAITGTPGASVLSGGVWPSGTGDVLDATIDGGSPDGTLRTDWSPASTDNAYGGLLFRVSDASHGWAASYFGEQVYLVRIAPTGRMIVGWAPVGPRTAHQVEVHLSGSTIEVWSDGALKIQTADWFNAAATRHGLEWWNLVDPWSEFHNFEMEGTLAPVVTTIDLTAPGTTLFVDQAETFTATAKDTGGAPVSGAHVVWSSSATGVLSESPSTLLTTTVTAHEIGTATITAMAPRGPASGASMTLTVAACTDPLSAASVVAPAAGGIGSFAVTAPAGCAWNARSEADWGRAYGGRDGNGRSDRDLHDDGEWAWPSACGHRLPRWAAAHGHAGACPLHL